jgi:hypothetical protein
MENDHDDVAARVLGRGDLVAPHDGELAGVLCRVKCLSWSDLKKDRIIWLVPLDRTDMTFFLAGNTVVRRFIAGS